jgi:hypothetical protein
LRTMSRTETCIFVVNGVEIPVALPTSWNTGSHRAWGVRACQIKSKLREACRRYLGPGHLYQDGSGYRWEKAVPSDWPDLQRLMA